MFNYIGIYENIEEIIRQKRITIINYYVGS